jgi:hypothetical protein
LRIHVARRDAGGSLVTVGCGRSGIKGTIGAKAEARAPALFAVPAQASTAICCLDLLASPYARRQRRRPRLVPEKSSTPLPPERPQHRATREADSLKVSRVERRRSSLDNDAAGARDARARKGGAA